MSHGIEEVATEVLNARLVVNVCVCVCVYASYACISRDARVATRLIYR